MTTNSPLARSEAWGLKADLMGRITKSHPDAPVPDTLLGLAEQLALEEVRDALAAASQMLGTKPGDSADAVVALTDVILRRIDFVVARSPVDLEGDD